jgi:hypothetical protein
MALAQFSLDHLTDFDGGRIATAFGQALKRCVDDCFDRPGVKEAREITIKVGILPVIGEDGDLDTVDLQFQIRDKNPIRKSKVYNLQARKNGALLFNDLADDNAHQRTLDEITDFNAGDE